MRGLPGHHHVRAGARPVADDLSVRALGGAALPHADRDVPHHLAVEEDLHPVGAGVGDGDAGRADGEVCAGVGAAVDTLAEILTEEVDRHRDLRARGPVPRRPPVRVLAVDPAPPPLDRRGGLHQHRLLGLGAVLDGLAEVHHDRLTDPVRAAGLQGGQRVGLERDGGDPGRLDGAEGALVLRQRTGGVGHRHGDRVGPAVGQLAGRTPRPIVAARLAGDGLAPRGHRDVLERAALHRHDDRRGGRDLRGVGVRRDGHPDLDHRRILRCQTGLRPRRVGRGLRAATCRHQAGGDTQTGGDQLSTTDHDVPLREESTCPRRGVGADVERCGRQTPPPIDRCGGDREDSSRLVIDELR